MSTALLALGTTILGAVIGSALTWWIATDTLRRQAEAERERAALERYEVALWELGDVVTYLDGYRYEPRRVLPMPESVERTRLQRRARLLATRIGDPLVTACVADLLRYGPDGPSADRLDRAARDLHDRLAELIYAGDKTTANPPPAPH